MKTQELRASLAKFIDPQTSNLKIMTELRPAGIVVRDDLSFPRTISDFALLKSLGADRTIQGITFLHDNSGKERKTIAVEITFKNGQKVTLGKPGGTSSYVMTENLKEVSLIEIEKSSNT
jgi:hypothetical protein